MGCKLRANCVVWQRIPIEEDDDPVSLLAALFGSSRNSKTLAHTVTLDSMALLSTRSGSVTRVPVGSVCGVGMTGEAAIDLRTPSGITQASTNSAEDRVQWVYVTVWGVVRVVHGGGGAYPCGVIQCCDLLPPPR